MGSVWDLLNEGLEKAMCKKHPLSVVIRTAECYIIGWNGPDYAHDCYRKGMKSGEDMYKCPTIHAEDRAIRKGEEEGINMIGAGLYMLEWFPCKSCAEHIVRAGIKTLKTPSRIYEDKNAHLLVEGLRGSSYDFESAEELLRKNGVEIVECFSKSF